MSAKMLSPWSTTFRVVVVKLRTGCTTCDARFLPAEKQQRIARETLDIYAPIAHRLGMGLIRGRASKISPSAISNPKPIRSFRDRRFEKKRVRSVSGGFAGTVRKRLEENGSRPKSRADQALYSIHQKSLASIGTIDQIYDLFAVRVITEYDPQLVTRPGRHPPGLRPVPGRFKDYSPCPGRTCTRRP